MNEQIISIYEKYLRTRRKMNETTIVNYIYDLKAFSVFINKSLFEVVEDDVKEWLTDKKNKGNGVNRINFSISTLSSFYKYAKRNNRVKQNPMLNIKRETVVKNEDEFRLTRRQIYEIRERLEEIGDTQLMVYYGLLVSAFPMKQVIGGLKWKDINWKKKYMLVKIDKDRSGILYLDNYTIEKLQLLRKMRKKEGLKRGNIFLTRYNGLNELTDDTQSYWLNKIKKIAGIEKLTFGTIKKANYTYLKSSRRFSEEKIELIRTHRVFPSDLKEEILKEVDEVLNMK
jgi:site-specific recombinase XerD